MAFWPNTRRDILGQQPVGISGYLAFQETAQRLQRGLAYFAGEQIEETSSVPEGAFPGFASILPPLVSGGMSAANNATDISATATGNVLAGGPVEGAASATFAQDGGLSLQVTLAGDGTITVSQSGSVALTIALAGDGAASITGAGGLSMIVPFDGAAAFALTGAANLKGNLSLAGDITPFTELSPQNLAAAVWGALATAINEPGTAGAALLAAGSAGDPWGTPLPGSYAAGSAGALLAALFNGLTTGQQAQLLEVWQRLGLDPANPMTTGPTSITFGAESIAITESSGSVTLTRDP